MSIIFDKEKKIFHLQTPNTSYVMRLIGEHILEHVYYGEKITSAVGLEYKWHDFKAFVADDYEYEGANPRISTEMIPQEYAFWSDII